MTKLDVYKKIINKRIDSIYSVCKRIDFEDNKPITESYLFFSRKMLLDDIESCEDDIKWIINRIKKTI